jgi:TRAP-type mannitol/chloroaromatic compound transport system permease large subunit
VPLTLEQVFAGVMPFLLGDVVMLALFIAFPAVVTFLPDLMV